MKNQIQKFITNNSSKLLSETSVQAILNNYYHSILNISYKLLSDKPFQIILTNFIKHHLVLISENSFQVILIQTFITELLKQHLQTYYQRIFSNNIQAQNHSKQLMRNYCQRNNFKYLQIIIRKWFQITHKHTHTHTHTHNIYNVIYVWYSYICKRHKIPKVCKVYGHFLTYVWIKELLTQGFTNQQKSTWRKKKTKYEEISNSYQWITNINTSWK